MSVGVFMSLRASYVEKAQAVAARYASAVDAVLRGRGLGGYVDPKTVPDVYRRGRFGRSGIDHHSAGAFVALGEMAEESEEPSPHLELLATNPFRLAYVPADFDAPLALEHTELIAGERPRLWVGSAPRLAEELSRMAQRLGIPLEGSTLSDEVADKIAAMELLGEGDDGALAEDERTVWLLLFEGARLANHHRVALSLAG